MAKKSDESLKIRQIQEWLIQGHLVTDICRNIMDKWGVDQKEAIKYIADAFQDFTKQTTKNIKDVRAYHIQLRLSLYKKAVEAKQYTTALRILADLAKIEEIYLE